VKYTLYVSDSELEFSDRFPKNTEILNIMKISPVRDGRTDMTKLIVAFRNFANAPEKAMFQNVLVK
jgi:hypothetical protein